MKKNLLAALILTAVAAGGWQLAKACALEFYRAVFSYTRHPDLPRTNYIDGRLGILQPAFARSYLVIAYRYLNVIGLDQREREQARDYYKDRETGTWDHVGTDWAARWGDVRSQIKSPAAPPADLIAAGKLSYDSDSHSFSLNCAEDAFRVAIHTLESRRTQFGAFSEAFHSWITAQDQVFANCSVKNASIPGEAAATLPPLLRADRHYQIAAAHFYAHQYGAALERFRRIGEDGGSPWSTISRYLALRTLLRMIDDPNHSVEAGAQLRSESGAILQDPKLVSIHGMTLNLITRASIRERDQLFFDRLAQLLSAKGQDDGFREDLWNYTSTYDQIIGASDPNAIFGPPKPPKADPTHFRGPDLTDWIFSFQSRDSSTFSHCLARWQKTRSPAWLIAALSHADVADATNTGLVNAASAIPADSPAYLTARFHLLRLDEEGNHGAIARDELDKLLSGPALRGLPSSVNLFRSLRMLAAPNLSDLLEFAMRKPVMITLQMNIGEVPGFEAGDSPPRPRMVDLFDRDATQILNHKTPYRLLKQVAFDERLSPSLHREALMTAFTRGLMLDEDLLDLAKLLGDTQPQMKPLTDAYRNGATDEDRRFAAAFLLLHHPEARPYFATGITRQSPPGEIGLYRDNWWCPMDIEVAMDSRVTDSFFMASVAPPLLPDYTASTPGFLPAGGYLEAQHEMDKLAKLSAAGDFLGSIVLPFAHAHPRDPRVPEALYWLIRVGRYGCADDSTWKTTRAAFRALHGGYPKTRWAILTPIWQKQEYTIRQEIKARASSY